MLWVTGKFDSTMRGRLRFFAGETVNHVPVFLTHLSRFVLPLLKQFNYRHAGLLGVMLADFIGHVIPIQN